MKETMKLRISVSIEKQFGERLSVNEEIELPVDGFIEACKILGEFDSLVGRIKKERGE